MRPEVFVTRRLPALALEQLSQSCQVDMWDHESPPPPYEKIVARTRDKEGLLCLLTDRIDAALMDAAPGLKVISQCAVGYDNIDIQAARARHIAVGNTPGVLTEATADFAFALLMASARRIGEAIDYVRNGDWKTWGLTILLGQDVHRATLGIVGMGRIGQALARRAEGFEMRVLYSDVARQPSLEARLGVEYAAFDDLLQQADFVSLHVNLTPQTTGLIGSRELALMKQNAILINTSRGQVVDPQALYQALKSGRISGAALDVTDPEPLPPDHRLLNLPNLIVVPHIASATESTRGRMAQMAVRNLIAGLEGNPLPNPVSG
jgi:glyoxylate reductase